MADIISVLYVDDETDLLDLGKLFLEQTGDFAVTTVLSAPEAILLLEKARFDAIISDYQMPGMDGIQFLIEVRTKFRSIPFILFTGKGREEVVIQAINGGADFYIQKGGDSGAQFAELSHKIKSAASRERAEDALRESEAKLSLFIRYCPIPVYIKDEDTRAVMLSHHFEKMLGKPLSQLLGKTGEELWPPKLAAEMRVDDGKVMTEGCIIEREETFNGRYFFSVKFPIPIPNHPTILGGYTIDITERKRDEDALRQANKKLNLLSSITRHDINNQLMVQMGYLEILKDSNLDPSQNEYFQNVLTAAQRISAMIRFTKEYDKIGVHAPVWQECRLLVDAAVTQAHLGRVIVENDLPADVEMFADPLIVKVCYNLMDNAVRYGGKTKSIRFFVEESDDTHLIVCEDDGVGVAADEKEKIFDRGFGKNTGLGLALSREILDITGITITETGEPGKGARFEMAVPNGMWRMASESRP